MGKVIGSILIYTKDSIADLEERLSIIYGDLFDVAEEESDALNGLEIAVNMFDEKLFPFFWISKIKERVQQCCLCSIFTKQRCLGCKKSIYFL